MRINNLALFIAAFLLSSSAFAVKIFTTGNTKDVQRMTNPLNCFAGGGSDDAWAEGWKQMLIQANGGDVVVIRADGKRGGYEEWLYNDSEGHGFLKVNSVTTILLEGPADAERADVEAKIRNAEMIFFAGGYQDLYLNWITGTRMHRALQYAMHTKQIPFGGTSAGVAIMGDINYTAKVEPPPNSGRFLTSQEVMKNPTASYVSLERGFMNPNYMDRVILDTHFSQRQREGRLVGFMARAANNHYGDVTPLTVRGIGVDENTAFCYGPKGRAIVFGDNSVYFLDGNALIERIMQGTSLEWLGQHHAVKVYAISAKNSAARFDLRTWTGSGGESRFWFVDGTDSEHPTFGDNAAD